MKNILIVLLLLVGSLPSLTAQCANTLKNPAASQGLTAWNRQGAADAAGGVFRLLKPKASLHQVVKIPKGARTAYLSGWTKAGNKKSGIPALSAQILDRNGNVIGQINTPANQTNSWKRTRGAANLPKGAVAIKVWMTRQDRSAAAPKDAIAYFDNLCLSFDCECKTPAPKDEENSSGGESDCCQGAVSDLEDVRNSSFSVGQTINSRGRSFKVETFRSSNGSIGHGPARMVKPGSPFRGNALLTSNSTLAFQIKRSTDCITFFAANKGGSVVVEINGKEKRFNRPGDLRSFTLAGVQVQISGNPSQGSQWTVSGSVRSFKIGGSELLLDDLCF
ncbi:MAG: hypothetical protein Sapg2KO_33420 [Saprospiraceae bacterium]